MPAVQAVSLPLLHIDTLPQPTRSHRVTIVRAHDERVVDELGPMNVTQRQQASQSTKTFRNS
jgi:hypothetical protein